MRVEFHCHTRWSKDSLLEPEKLIAACKRKGLGKVVITDHNTILGAQAAQRLAPEYVVVGEEIMTTKGELLAFFVEQAIPAGLTPEDAIRRLREQGAFISVSHPFDEYRNGAWAIRDLDPIIDQVDAIEVFNSRCLKQSSNDLAILYALQHQKPGTAGSDAHAAMELGTAVVDVPNFDSAEGLKAVLGQGTVIGRLSPFWVHFFSQWARWRKRMKRS